MRLESSLFSVSLVVIAACALPHRVSSQTAQRPVIDMHLHASSPEEFGGPQTVCTNRDGVEFPPIDPRDEMTVQAASICPAPMMSVPTGAENARQTAEMMTRYNMYGVLNVTVDGGGIEASLDRGGQWREYAPDRYWLALDFADAGMIPLDDLEQVIRQGKIDLLAEISPQYQGKTPTAEEWAPYFALAERLDVAVGLHLGEGPPGGAHVEPGSEYSPAAGRPLDLDPLLRRHPDLRIYVMHYGSPLVEETIALLYAHPNVYVDVAQNNWSLPRAHFYRQLQQLVDAGFGKRIMFGSDQMIWPGTIEVAIETIEEAPFLTEAQKRDILYNNAARFLRLSDEDVARHHGREPGGSSRL
jgi:predicted TIM-barrel fold metal-dependent hydrolase